MARKELSKIDADLETAKAKVAQLEEERKKAEEESFKKIGQAYFQLKRKKDKSITHKEILSSIKQEIAALKNESKLFPGEDPLTEKSNQ
ncbi:hypothetical protein SUF15_09885 [Streptococcus agalactiae]|uniref:hypothetical protein n=1 Tax=Streptococcus agalactiae TaxID=1311 RepID=UPI001374CE32|nr:hypothetical protein [Streptococcus agalactiae]KAF1260939.1 hypothetical protein B8V75_04060 [Streptococcus agalactiae]KAF1271410.1 hypothetical protein B8V71_02660 [Streptococcus agalactiae]HEN0543774.1 hypothetical protein [Streptococcus agalactiae]